MHRHTVIYFVCAVITIACTPANVQKSPEERLAENKKICADRYGFKEGSSDFGQCLMEMDRQYVEKQRERDRREAEFVRSQNEINSRTLAKEHCTGYGQQTICRQF